MIIVRQIPKEAAWPLRHEVMWPEKPIDYVILKDDDLGTHWGLYVEEQLVSIVSLFIQYNEAQFRKFATLQHEQGKGYGSKLLRHVMEHAQLQGVERIWCNARKDKAGYYRKFGLLETGQVFDKDGISYVIMETLFS